MGAKPALGVRSNSDCCCWALPRLLFSCCTTSPVSVFQLPRFAATLIYGSKITVGEVLESRGIGREGLASWTRIQVRSSTDVLSTNPSKEPVYSGHHHNVRAKDAINTLVTHQGHQDTVLETWEEQTSL